MDENTLMVSVRREAVSGKCPECGGVDIRSYPVISEKGWQRVVKCQSCLASLSREQDDTSRASLLSLQV